MTKVKHKQTEHHRISNHLNSKNEKVTHACDYISVVHLRVTVWRQSDKNFSSTRPVHTVLIMAALCSRCGHYIFVLWFLLLSSIFFPLPNLSRHRLDVYHTSTHGVALYNIFIHTKCRTLRTVIRGKKHTQITHTKKQTVTDSKNIEKNQHLQKANYK